MDKLLVICGPTATGKTGLAVKLAKKFDGELISADSRQVYKGMDVGTGKDHPRGIKIHLIDVVTPDKEFSVSQYYQLAWQAIRKIWSKGKLPILVGGTGFYIKAVVDGVETLGISPNWELRKKLSNLDIKKLREILEKTCPERMRGMNESDKNNPRRLIRAIEITRYKSTSEVSPPENSGGPSTSEVKLKEILFIGLTAPYKTLYQRIDKRVDERIKMGAEKEVRELLKKGYSWELPSMNSMGYVQWKPFFDGKINLEEVIKRWSFAEHAYARRQMTWFKKDNRIYWFDISQKRWQDKVVKLVKEWLIKENAKKD